jgi:metallo-beta-lactamase family protein
VPVFIDSPLGIRITRLYQEMDQKTRLGAKTSVTVSCHLYALEKFQDHQRLLKRTRDTYHPIDNNGPEC